MVAVVWEQAKQAGQGVLPRAIGSRDLTAFFVGVGGAFHYVGALSPVDDNAPPLGFAHTVCWNVSGISVYFKYCPMKKNKTSANKLDCYAKVTTRDVLL